MKEIAAKQQTFLAIHVSYSTSLLVYLGEKRDFAFMESEVYVPTRLTFSQTIITVFMQGVFS